MTKGRNEYRGEKRKKHLLMTETVWRDKSDWGYGRGMIYSKSSLAYGRPKQKWGYGAGKRGRQDSFS